MVEHRQKHGQQAYNTHDQQITWVFGDGNRNTNVFIGTIVMRYSLGREGMAGLATWCITLQMWNLQGQGPCNFDPTSKFTLIVPSRPEFFSAS
jgi:hypothetical protein